jgi:uncharacterized membrane protein HdeD (DUF308 family)
MPVRCFGGASATEAAGAKPMEEQSYEPKQKPWYKSRTNGLGGAAVLLGLAILGMPEFAAVIDQLPIQYHGNAWLLVGVVTVILRHLTNQAIAWKKEKAAS